MIATIVATAEKIVPEIVVFDGFHMIAVIAVIEETSSGPDRDSGRMFPQLLKGSRIFALLP